MDKDQNDHNAELAAGDINTTVVHADSASHVAHTPGPWRWFAGARADTTKPHMKYLVGANEQGFGHTVGLQEPEDTANAHLIAAAPELLAACKALVTLHADPLGGVLEMSARQRAREAIAKAEGR